MVPLADPDHETVKVPLTQNPLSAEQYTLLYRTFDPTEMSSDCDGADIYCAVHQYVHVLFRNKLLSPSGLLPEFLNKTFSEVMHLCRKPGGKSYTKLILLL